MHDRDEAIALLVSAHGASCLDAALAAIQRHTPDDLAAAHILRAQRLDDPVEFLRALTAAEETLRRKPDSQAARFNRALAQEKLGLTREAIHSWDELLRLDRSAWSGEARRRRERLMNARELRWNEAELREALARRDAAALTRLAKTFPSETMRYFEESDLLGDLVASRLLADVLLAGGEPYARAIVDAAVRTRDRQALEEGLRALREDDYDRAARLLERAGNPLALRARYDKAVQRYIDQDPAALPLLDQIAPEAARHNYHDLSCRIHTMRANALDMEGRYLEALRAYDKALAFARGAATPTVNILGRRSFNYLTIGSADLSFRDAFRALSLLPAVSDVNARHHAYAGAAEAAGRLLSPAIALQYQNLAIEVFLRDLSRKSGNPEELKHHLVIALRERADTQLALGDDAGAAGDLLQASRMFETMKRVDLRNLVNIRLAEVQGQMALRSDPVAAAEHFGKAIVLASQESSTYRAVLHFKRSAARRAAGLPGVERDTADALRILEDEATLLLHHRKPGQYEDLWTPYFSRFQAMYHEIIERELAAGDEEEAFLHAEQARAFEPMHLLLHSHAPPPGFRKLRTKADLRRQLAALPADTVILQYVVLDERTYTFVLSRGNLDVMSQPVGRETIARWVADLNDALSSKQRDPFTRVMRAAYTGLLRDPLKLVTRPDVNRFVIVPDGPIYGLPFAGMEGTKRERSLLERGTIAIAGSTSLYAYALARDRQLADGRTSVLVVGEPVLGPGSLLGRLPHARAEAEELGRMYGTRPLLGREATIEKFLDGARKATIIHFAGHAVSRAEKPRASMLLLAPGENDLGHLTAERLLTDVSELAHTRLIVLAACSTASGQQVGPEGLAPLVRPLVAANVPAVVGTLWDVNDATAKELVVSFHRHYRNGHDVAAALRCAQLEMLRNNEPAMTWAAFQVIGHAGSPFAPAVATEERRSDRICTEDPVHRPDGLHPQ